MHSHVSGPHAAPKICWTHFLFQRSVQALGVAAWTIRVPEPGRLLAPHPGRLRPQLQRRPRAPPLPVTRSTPSPPPLPLPAPCASWPPRCALPFPLASSPSALQLPSPSLWVIDERAASLPPRPVKPLTRVHAVLLSCKSAPTPEEHAHTNHVLTHHHTECKHGPEAGLRSAS